MSCLIYLFFLCQLTCWSRYIGGRIVDLWSVVMTFLKHNLDYVIMFLFYVFLSVNTWMYEGGCSNCSTLLLLMVLLSRRRETSSEVPGDLRQFPILRIQPNMAVRQTQHPECSRGSLEKQDYSRSRRDNWRRRRSGGGVGKRRSQWGPETITLTF